MALDFQLRRVLPHPEQGARCSQHFAPATVFCSSGNLLPSTIRYPAAFFFCSPSTYFASWLFLSHPKGFFSGGTFCKKFPLKPLPKLFIKKFWGRCFLSELSVICLCPSGAPAKVVGAYAPCFCAPQGHFVAAWGGSGEEEAKQAGRWSFASAKRNPASLALPIIKNRASALAPARKINRISEKKFAFQSRHSLPDPLRCGWKVCYTIPAAGAGFPAALCSNTSYGIA